MILHYNYTQIIHVVDSSCYPNQTLLCDSDIVNITSNSRDAVVIPSLLHLADNDDHWCPSTAEIDLPLVITFSFSETVLLTSMAISGKKTINADLFVASYSLSYATDTSCNLKLYEDLFGGSVSACVVLGTNNYYCTGISQQSCEDLCSFILGTHSCPPVAAGSD